MQPNPLLPSIPEMLLIGGIGLAIFVAVGIVLAVWLTRRSRDRSASDGDEGGGR